MDKQEAAKLRKKENEFFRKYIANKKIVIADPSPTARSGVSRVFNELGATSSQLILANSYDTAVQEINAHRPDIVLTEYNLGAACGLDLLQSQRAAHPEFKHSIFILLTSDTSQSAVAQAAEEDVDAYLVKPFTPDNLRRAILRTAITKVKPPPYLVKIENGKDNLQRGDFETAEKHFSEAMELDSRPSLACYYLGRTKAITKVLEQAQDHFQKGLNYNKTHYKCLVGLFELLMEMKKYDEAYTIAKRISDYFPVSAKRLMNVLRLAVVNRRFDDIDRYYAIYLGLDERDKALTNHVCAALVVTGKFFLQNAEPARAFDAFNKAAVTAAGNIKILGEIVQTLINFRHPDEADRILRRFPRELQKSQEYLLLDFQIANLVDGTASVLAKGRALIAQGIVNETLFEIMLIRSRELKLKFPVQDLLAEAVQKYPELKDKFESLLAGSVHEPEVSLL